MDNDELHARLCEILLKLVPVLCCDDLRDLSAGCGIPVSDWYGSSDQQIEAKEIIEWRNAA